MQLKLINSASNSIIKEKEIEKINNLNEIERKIYEEILGRQSLRIDELVEITKFPIAKINSAIMTLWLKKLINKNSKGELILNN